MKRRGKAEEGREREREREKDTNSEKRRDRGEEKIWVIGTLKMNYGVQEREEIEENRNTERGVRGGLGTCFENLS